MTSPFFERPIVNSPYEHPRKHWELDQAGQPTGALLDHRRRAEFITPIPKPKKRKASSKQEELGESVAGVRASLSRSGRGHRGLAETCMQNRRLIYTSLMICIQN